jgi:hypothetical protein
MKVVLANAIQHIGQSVKIWLAPAELEQDTKAKKCVLRKALEHIPNSICLWKETVNLESSTSGARILLAPGFRNHPTVHAALARFRPLGIDEHLHHHFQIPQIRKTLHGPRPNPSTTIQQHHRLRLIRSWNQILPQITHPLDPHQPTQKGKREGHQSPRIA